MAKPPEKRKFGIRKDSALGL
ncbi:hypothetical protein CCACVL1_28160 [Corchorus capsularis]|uniref:Uncharacterized protein n=1 Tax=Corchorus capsularis TaxID=210143 RepID=A0A1R3G7D0_COCAP|nr:hypothetical protein CCACVL1_28160 [Corchorus capsularis]